MKEEIEIVGFPCKVQEKFWILIYFWIFFLISSKSLKKKNKDSTKQRRKS